jgi:hypothetical protein
MKILILATNNNEYRNVLEGWGNALVVLQHEVLVADPNLPLFRVVDQTKPDLMILALDAANRAVNKVVQEFKLKTVIWTDKQPEEFQKIAGAIWTSFDPALNITGLEYVPVGFDETIFKKVDDEAQKYSISICERELSPSEHLWFSQNRLCRLYSSSVKRIPNYVGVIQDRYSLYRQSDTIYALDMYSDIGNMQAVGAKVKTTIENDVDFIPPYDSYINIMQKFMEKIS